MDYLTPFYGIYWKFSWCNSIFSYLETMSMTFIQRQINISFIKNISYIHYLLIQMKPPHSVNIFKCFWPASGIFLSNCTWKFFERIKRRLVKTTTLYGGFTNKTRKFTLQIILDNCRLTRIKNYLILSFTRPLLC